MRSWPTPSSLRERAEPDSAGAAVVYIVLSLLAFAVASGLGTTSTGDSDLASHAVTLVTIGFVAAGSYGVLAGAAYWDNTVTAGMGVLLYVMLCFCAVGAVFVGLLIVVDSLIALFG